MEQPTVSQLKGADYNPRKLSDRDARALRKTIDELGDLSGIIKNIATGNLVGGHQRVKIFKEMGQDAKIKVTWRAEAEPTKAGTTAEGYIEHPLTGEHFSYREVYWANDSTDQRGQQFSSKERVANLAANHISGEDDKEKLAQINYDLQQLDNYQDDLRMMTGLDDKYIEQLNESIGYNPDGESQPDEIGEDPHEAERRQIAATKEQWSTIEEAMQYVKDRADIPFENEGSRNSSALYYICHLFLDGARRTEQDNAPKQPDVQPQPTPLGQVDPDSLTGGV